MSSEVVKVILQEKLDTRIEEEAVHMKVLQIQEELAWRCASGAHSTRRVPRRNLEPAVRAQAPRVGFPAPQITRKIVHRGQSARALALHRRTSHDGTPSVPKAVQEVVRHAGIAKIMEDIRRPYELKGWMSGTQLLFFFG